MVDVAFASTKELYERVKPALETKTEELKRMGMTYITKEDVWNYLKNNVWNHSHDLRLYRMVDNILNADNLLIDDYVKSKMSLKERKVYFKDIEEEDVNENKNE